MKKKSSGRFLKENVQKRAMPQQITPRKSSKSRQISKPALIFTILALLLSLVACVYFLSNLGISFSAPASTIAEGVKIAGVNVGGMTKNEAEAAITEQIADTYASQSMCITVLDQKLELSPAVSGVKLDVEGVVSDAFRYGTDGNPTKNVDLTPHIMLDGETIEQQIQTLAAHFPTDGTAGGYEVVTKTVNGEEQQVLVVTLGTASYNFDADGLYRVILNAYAMHRFEAVYDCTMNTAASIDLDAVFQQTRTEPVDAVWDPENHTVKQEVPGLQFDLEAAKAALSAAEPGDVLEFPYEEVSPEVCAEDLENVMFTDLLGTYTAKSTSSHNRDTNLRLACESLDGIILYPGDTFSYNEALGERTPEKGYKPADSYMGSETIQTYGGGICQPSSSLYYCALIADLEIVQRSNHGFISSYMPYGMDATVDWSGPDFKFRNNTNYPIRIDAEANGGTVTVSLYGTDEKDYYVEMEYEILSVTSPKTVEKEVGPDEGHKNGEVEVTPYTGYSVQTYKCKYDKETKELISREKEAYSDYSKRDKVVYKVVEKTEPTEPEVTEPEETEPKPTEPEVTEPEITEPVTPPVGEAGGDVELPSE